MQNVQEKNKLEKDNMLGNVAYNTKKARNDANNANLVKNISDVASKSANPYAKAAGTAVKAADKLTGGKASQKLGKSLTKTNKLASPFGTGKAIQKLSNKLSESGTSNRIASALSKKNFLNSINPLSNFKGAKENSVGETNLKEKTEEETPNKGFTSFAASMKVLKIGMIAFAACLPVIIFCVCLISASQVFISAIDLGIADTLTNPEVEDKINKKESDDLNEEITDDHEHVKDAQAYVSPDMYISDKKSVTLRNSKLDSYNIVQIANTKYNTEIIEQLEDFYPSIINESKNYDENLVYDFYYKIYRVYMNYYNEYSVSLDLPLLMSTLKVQSSDMYVIYSSNLSSEYRTNKVSDIPVEQLDYYYDWSSYKLSKDNSEHDIEILAQHMVSEKTSNQCSKPEKDGKCYEIDEEKYREFLKEFLEKKYYLEESGTIEGEYGSSSSSGQNQNTTNGNITTTPASGNFRNWTQCGQSWSSKIVPNSSETMCQIGCLITSISIQIARSGTVILTDNIDPGIAMEKFNFASGGALYWYSTTNLAPNFQFYTKIELTGMKRESIAKKLTSYDSSRYYIVLGVGKIDRNTLHHYVALDYVDTSNNKIYIMDPAGVEYTDLYDRYKLYTAHIYEKKD